MSYIPDYFQLYDISTVLIPPTTENVSIPHLEYFKVLKVFLVHPYCDTIKNINLLTSLINLEFIL